MAEPTLDRKSSVEIQDMIATIMKMVLLGALFAAVGYLLILGALFLELTQFHPLLEEFFRRGSAEPPASRSDRRPQGPRERVGRGSLPASRTKASPAAAPTGRDKPR